MKKLLLSSATFLLLAVTAFAYPNEKVLNAFNKTFFSPAEVKWTDNGNTYEAAFIQGGIRTIASYDAEGAFLGSLRYYTEKDLPFYIASEIKKKFPDRTIYGVSEQIKDDQLTYYVKLQNSTHWYTLKVGFSGSMEITEKFKKA